MSQHDFDIANQSASSARTDINNALKALSSLSSGSTAPATTYANMLWYDTGNNCIKMRSEADDSWIDLGTLDQSSNTFSVAGLDFANQSEAEDGTNNTKLMTPLRVKQAIESTAETTSTTVLSSTTITKPAGEYIRFRLWAGGSGGQYGPEISHGGSGGGGGSYVESIWFPLADLPSSLTLTVGAGGAGATAEGLGSDGGNTRVEGVGVLCEALGAVNSTTIISNGKRDVQGGVAKNIGAAYFEDGGAGGFGDGGSTGNVGETRVYAGAGGNGGPDSSNSLAGANSLYGGNGGSSGGVGQSGGDGQFPSGGGAGGRDRSGSSTEESGGSGAAGQIIYDVK